MRWGRNRRSVAAHAAEGGGRLMAWRAVDGWLLVHQAAMEQVAEVDPTRLPQNVARSTGCLVERLSAGEPLVPADVWVLAIARRDRKRAERAIEADERLRLLNRYLTLEGGLARAQRRDALRAMRDVARLVGWWTYVRCIQRARRHQPRKPGG